MKKIAQGAEAIITLNKGGDIVTKNRTPKSYRHEKLDQQIRTRRTKSEAKLLTKAGEIINTPAVLNQDKFTIHMQHLSGERLSETLNSKPLTEQYKIMQQIGEQIAKLHDNNIIHGDLTTSNTILQTENKPRSQNPAEITNPPVPARAHQDDRTQSSTISSSMPKVFLIDFGLGFISTRIEDKAVDLHLIKQALEAKHFQNHDHLFFQLLESYHPQDRDKILEQLQKVEARGRYKH